MPRRIRADDIVITPTGRRAQVRVVDDQGFAQLIYLDDRQQVTLQESLLERMHRGEPAPAPVRIGHDGRRL